MESLLPLKGIRVVELAGYIAVPVATRVFSEWGAEVIKIENSVGDAYRYWGAVGGNPIKPDENPIFYFTNMNKKLVCLDPKKPEGLEALRRLIDSADVFVSNVRTPSLMKMGLSYETLSKTNPGLVMACFTGFGSKGPNEATPGFDSAAFWARCGALDWRDMEDFPIRPAIGFGDMVSSWPIISGILAGLFGRESTGTGTFLESSLLATSLWSGFYPVISENEAYRTGEGSKWSTPSGKSNPIMPFGHYYSTKDGAWINLVARDYEKDYDSICRTLGMDEYVGDSRYNKLTVPPENKHEFYEIIKACIGAMDCEEALTRLRRADVVCEKLTFYKDVHQDGQVWANDFLQKLVMPSGASANLPALPVRFSAYDTTGVYDCPGRLGKDTDSCLERVGYTKEMLERLREAKAIL